MSEARERILSMLRQGRESAPFAIQTPPVPGTTAETSPEPAADWRRVAAALEPVNGRLLLARDAQQAKALFFGILQEVHAASAARWEHPLLQALGLDGWLEEAEVALCHGETGPLCQQLAEVDVGVTAVDAVFALAGTLVLMSGAGRGRSLSLVPPTHVALAPQSLLYPDLSSLPALLRKRLAEEGRLPGAVHLVTGSSSTADIEQTLVRPAHGPALVRVLGLQWL